ncbi:hypothetical protein C8R46DRAFT_1213438 [Mycena filopes]|nr:hypothetical protein C8R46DRAFT_1213438 [Mycena filopes]
MHVNPAAIAHGPMLIGVMLNVLLMGVVIMQMYIYFTNYNDRDGRWLKSLLAFIFFANLLNTVFSVADLYLAVVSHFVLAGIDLVQVILHNHSPPILVFATNPVIGGTVASSVQLFFAWRVHILTGKWYLSASTGLLAMGQLGEIVPHVSRRSEFDGQILVCAVLVGWKCREFPSWADFPSNFTSVIIAWMTTTILVDTTITVILVWYLVCLAADCRLHTDKLVDRIVRLTVQTGLLTSVWALTDLVLFLTLRNASHLIFQIPMVKLHTASVMSSLNSRGSHRPSPQDSFESGVHTRGKLATPRGLRKASSAYRLGAPTRPEVFVHVERLEMGDLPAASSRSARDVKNKWGDNTTSGPGPFQLPTLDI